MASGEFRHRPSPPSPPPAPPPASGNKAARVCEGHARSPLHSSLRAAKPVAGIGGGDDWDDDDDVGTVGGHIFPNACRLS